MDRSQEIIRTSWIGIVANVLLAGFKAAVGILASSVAIVMDAVNNLSDALSSVITIIGTKLSQRPADRKHPFGFGRIEYFSAIIIAVIVLSGSSSTPVSHPPSSQSRRYSTRQSLNTRRQRSSSSLWPSW